MAPRGWAHGVRLLALVSALLLVPCRGIEPHLTTCQNPLFRVHWHTLLSCDGNKHCPSSLNKLPMSSMNLTLCKHWNALSSCCNLGLEAAQSAAFGRWKDTFGLVATDIRTYVAQMILRQMTPLYKDASYAATTAFDGALDELERAAASYPKCMLALLREAAGMICYMCDPQWEMYMYRGADPVDTDAHIDIFRAAETFRSISISTSACSSLWQGCSTFSVHARKAIHRILESPLSKQVSAPIPDLSMYFDKPGLCEWARKAIAFDPFRETAPGTAKPTMPALPADAMSTRGPTEPSAGSPSTTGAAEPTRAPGTSRAPPPLGLVPALVKDRRLEGESVTRTPRMSYFVVTFNTPCEVRIGRAEQMERLRLPYKLGGEELGHVGQVAVDDAAGSEYLYLAVEQDNGLDEVVQYKYTFIKGQPVLQAPVTVWPSEGSAEKKIMQMRVHNGNLYIATQDGQVLKVDKNVLPSGARTDGLPLFSSGGVEEYKDQTITGLAIVDNMYWSTSHEIHTGPRDGSMSGQSSKIFDSKLLEKLMGSGERPLIRDIEVSKDGVYVYIATHTGGVSQTSSIFWFNAAHPEDTPVRLMQDWAEDNLTLSLNDETLYVASDRSIYAVQAPFDKDSKTQPIYEVDGNTYQKLIDIGLYEVPGVDCTVTPWRQVSDCSRSCGGGKLKEERAVVTPPQNGGKPCPILVRMQNCSMAPCGGARMDCRVSQWINDEECSTTCGGGKVKQRREILRQPGGGGTECPKLVRTADCRVGECGGLDFIITGMPIPQGMYTAKLEDIKGNLEMKPAKAEREYPTPDLFAVDAQNNFAFTGHDGGKLLRQWKYSCGDHEVLTLFASRVLWDAEQKPLEGARRLQGLPFFGGGGAAPSTTTAPPADDRPPEDPLIAIAASSGALYAATADGRIVGFVRNDLVDMSFQPDKSIPFPNYDLYTGQGELVSIAVSGTYLAWAIKRRVTLGSIEGEHPESELRDLVTPDHLREMTGSEGAVVRDIALSTDGSGLFLLIWDTFTKALALYLKMIQASELAGARVTQLHSNFPSDGELRLAITPTLLIIYDISSKARVWSTPVRLEADDVPEMLYNPASDAHISALTYLFVKGIDCTVSGWRTMSACDKPCGGGVMKEARTIQQEPQWGGSECPAELEREIHCNEDPCAVDCGVSDWLKVGRCTKTCGGGTIMEERRIIQSPSHGGRACPPTMQQVVACNTRPCAGVDCVLTDWINAGGCSQTCGKGTQKQYRRILVHDEFGGYPCGKYHLIRHIVCNPTPCQLESFDPIAAGRLTGFDFGVAEYCEDPTRCATAEGVEADLGLYALRPAAGLLAAEPGARAAGAIPHLVSGVAASALLLGAALSTRGWRRAAPRRHGYDAA